MKILAALYLATLFLLVFLGTTGLSLPSHTGSWESERDYFYVLRGFVKHGRDVIAWREKGQWWFERDGQVCKF